MLDKITVSEALAGMIAAGAAGGVLAGIITPLFRWRRRIEKIEEKNIALCSGFYAMGLCMIALLDHEISGNDIERVKAARDKLQSEIFKVGLAANGKK